MGALRINGNEGNTGQVLVSQGTSNPPSWQNTAFAEPNRFLTNIADNDGLSNGTINLSNVIYNLNPSQTTIKTTNHRHQFNKGGLYHFDLNVYSAKAYSVWPGAAQYPTLTVTCRVLNSGGTILYTRYLIRSKVLNPLFDSKSSWNISEALNFDLHLANGSQIELSYLLWGSNTSVLTNFLYGHFGGYYVHE